MIDELLIILIQHFIYEHIIVVNRNLLTQLLFEGQGNGVGLSFRVSDAPLQVGVIEALPSSQALSRPVKAKAWHQDQVQTSWIMREDSLISDEGMKNVYLCLEIWTANSQTLSKMLLCIYLMSTVISANNL